MYLYSRRSGQFVFKYSPPVRAANGDRRSYRRTPHMPNCMLQARALVPMRSLEIRDLEADADEALAEAREMPPGPKRSKALKRAGQLRLDASILRWTSSHDLQSPE